MPKVKATGEVPAKKVEGEAKGVSMRVLVGPEDGAPNFVMREFTLEKEGQTPYHSHTWEHEVFVLEGTGVVVGEAEETRLEANRAVFVASGEKHCFRNTGERPFRFLCIIPTEENSCGG
jgi:quercetin dioxygenase-like cupin family protein